jgi:hypothetical protein
MSQRSDWLPASRERILAMVKTWLVVIAANLQKRGVPESVLQALTALAGAHVTGSPSELANKGCLIHYSVAAPGKTPPVKPDDFRKSFYIKRKKNIIEFDFGDSGKTAYFLLTSNYIYAVRA